MESSTAKENHTVQGAVRQISGEIPYTAHGAQITPSPLFLIIFMLILG